MAEDVLDDAGFVERERDFGCGLHGSSVGGRCIVCVSIGCVSSTGLSSHIHNSPQMKAGCVPPLIANRSASSHVIVASGNRILRILLRVVPRRSASAVSFSSHLKC